MDVNMCRNCGHEEKRHPKLFFCDMPNCRCAGWVKLVEGITDGN